MHKKFDHKEIEKKWQQIWKESGIYNVGGRDESKEKEYVLVEWPYPSGNLHIGHWFAFAVVDIYVRARRMQGKQVLFPIGFDAFGLPAENAAIKRNLDPKAWTESNIEFMRGQLESMGNAFSWDKTTSSTDPEYYKWTQWMFTEFFKNNIAYRGTGVVNWCPGCNTVIANEQVLGDNTCERSGDTIEKREMPQWMLRITQYADRLIDDLDALEWPEHIKESQRQWIGRSKGAELTFEIKSENEKVKIDELTVFTTRPDTLYGATYVVLAPDHDLVLKHKDILHNWDEIVTYQKVAAGKDDMERMNVTKEKTGVKLEGIIATNPATGEDIPVYIADYVLKGYGTGAIMAVPAHDERDFEFAKKFNLRVTDVVTDSQYAFSTSVGAILISKEGKLLLQKNDTEAPNHANKITTFGGAMDHGETPIEALRRELMEELELDINSTGVSTRIVRMSANIGPLYVVENVDASKLVLHEGEAIVEVNSLSDIPATEKADHIKNLTNLDLLNIQTNSGILINSGNFDGMNSEEAKEAITKKVGGKLTNTYRLRDWSIGRQRYWGVPIPIVYDPEGKTHPIPKEHLPWLLPTDVDFKPTGVAPLAKSQELKKRTERIFGKGWTPEVETMDTFVDSSWYFLRYLDAHNEHEPSSKKAQSDWMPIDIYFGGAEHTTMHLLYSRFWQKVLYDLKLVNDNEPYIHRINRGLVLGPDGNKMSKSKGNVIDPDEHVQRLGADTVKLYLAFMGPYGESSNYPWDMGGIVGIRRFLERVYGLNDHIIDDAPLETKKLLNVTIAKVTADIEAFKFNTAISACMIFVNHVEKQGISLLDYKQFLRLLAPFAPHITEELWKEIGENGSVHTETLPVADMQLTINNGVTIAVQINGKMRGTIKAVRDSNQETILGIVHNDEFLKGKLGFTPRKVVFVQNKIINILS